MIKNFTFLLVIALMISFVGTGRVYSQDSKNDKAARRLAKIKAGINKIGTGPDAKVSVKLNNRKQVIGTISSISDDNFTVIDKDGSSNTIAFAEVKRINGKNLSTGAWVAIGAGIGAAAFFIAFWLWLENN